MKITNIETIIVNVPNEAPWRWAIGVFYGTTRTIIKVHTDEGIVGLGEAPFNGPKRVIDTEIRPILIGQDPFEIEKLSLKCLPTKGSTGVITQYGNTTAFGGVEMALWDIIGKTVKKPICKLMGGEFRSKVPFVEYFAPRYKGLDGVGGESTPKEIANFCLKKIEKYRANTLEGKVGIFSPKRDVEIVKEIRKAVGYEVDIRIDANMAWSPTVAIQTIKAMEKYEISNIEEPTRTLEGMARIKKKINTPISTHSTDIARIIELDAADAIVSDLHTQGGFIQTKRLLAIVERFDLDFWFHSHQELGISTSAYLHFAASSPYMIHPSQTLIHHQLDDVIIGGKLNLKNGCIPVPKGNGLGVELDENRVMKYSKLYDQEGPYKYHVDLERKDWFPMMPTW